MQNGSPKLIPISSNGGHVQTLDAICAGIHSRVESFLAKDSSDDSCGTLKESTQQRCRESLQIIKAAIARYPTNTLSLSYNGGKDCLVLLLLYLCCLHDVDEIPESLPAVYIPSLNPFPIVDKFVTKSAAQYHITLIRQTMSPKCTMRDAFETYLQSNEGGRQVRAIFVGTRRTDPHGEHLTPFDMTDHGWPSFMRVHPVLEWQYSDIWTFLKWMEVDWCPLYDDGYTSLGGVGDTHPNPSLQYFDPIENKLKFRPAWELTDGREERSGRY